MRKVPVPTFLLIGPPHANGRPSHNVFGSAPFLSEEEVNLLREDIILDRTPLHSEVASSAEMQLSSKLEGTPLDRGLDPQQYADQLLIEKCPFWDSMWYARYGNEEDYV